MAVFKCKICGGSLDVADGSSIAVCDYCGTKQTVPTTNDDVVANLFNRANNLRLKCEFDKAEQVYEKILDIDNTDSEAHWGMVLCKYGIEYVEDKKTDSKIPTCHRTLYEAILTDVDYLATIENADAAQKELYEAEALVIDDLQKNILNIVNNEEPFDVFICYKETDESGRRTIDSSIANDIYYQLSQEGFKVFYAPITLENKLGYEYEPYIFAALNSAKVMLVVGTKPEHFDSVWVRNEWSRYLKLMKSERSKLLIPCYRDIDAYELPDEFSHLQAQDMSKIGFIQDLLRGITKLVSSSNSQPAIVKETVIRSADSNITPLLKRVFIFLEDEDWDNAEKYCEKVLDINPECAEAYLGKLMVELQVKTRETLKECQETFEYSPNYQKAIRFSDSSLAAELTGYIAIIKDRNIKKAKEEHNESIYIKALNAYKSNDIAKLTKAVELFTEISDWKDSKELLALCQTKIAQIKVKDENDRMERARIAVQKRLEYERKYEQQKELKRIAKEKAQKRNKIIATIIVPVIVAIIVFFTVINTNIIPNLKYNKAVTLISEGKYVDANNILLDLNNYKDSLEIREAIKTDVQNEILKSATVGDIIKYGLYEQDNIRINGKEKIEWIVLSKNDKNLLLISRYILDNQKFNTDENDTSTWSNSLIRTWLNREFKNEAFSATEEQIICNTSIKESLTTNDKIFLLSIDEANTYFKTDNERKCENTEYSKLHSMADEGEWWLRTKDDSEYGTYKSNDIAVVHWHGAIADGDNSFMQTSSYSYSGVRPAMWIDISRVEN